MGTPHQNLIERRFGRLLVESYADQGKWNCLCDCGVKISVETNRLNSGHTLSCGCYHRDKKTLHGRSRTPLHGVWLQLRNRCNNPQYKAYHNYGGRGVKVCERWAHFSNFFADMGERPDGAWLDRINNDGDYEPGNCRWISPKDQQNNKRTNLTLEFNGKTQTATQWAEELSISYWTLLNRLRRGWSHEKALATPIHKEFRNK